MFENAKPVRPAQVGAILLPVDDWTPGGPRAKGQGTRDKGQGTRDKGQGTRDKGQGTRRSSSIAYTATKSDWRRRCVCAQRYQGVLPPRRRLASRRAGRAANACDGRPAEPGSAIVAPLRRLSARPAMSRRASRSSAPLRGSRYWETQPKLAAEFTDVRSIIQPSLTNLDVESAGPFHASARGSALT